MIAVVFDMDGVIFDTEAICRRAWHACAGKYNIQDVDALLIPCIGANKQHMRKVFHEQLGEDFPVEAFDRDAREGFLRIEREEGIPVKKGARELLSWLKEQGAVVGLASSTAHDIVVQELTDAGLVDYFQAITGGDQITHSKPDPEIYLKACEKLGIDPKDSLRRGRFLQRHPFRLLSRNEAPHGARPPASDRGDGRKSPPDLRRPSRSPRFPGRKIKTVPAELCDKEFPQRPATFRPLQKERH